MVLFYKRFPSFLKEHKFNTQVQYAVESRCNEQLDLSVRRALLSAAGLHLHERIGGGEELSRCAGANSAAAPTSEHQGAAGGSREHPVRLDSSEGERGRLLGSGAELGAVAAHMLLTEAG